MPTRGSDKHLDILPESPGYEHLTIGGVRLPTYNQVLLSYLANVEKLRVDDKMEHEEIVWASCIIVASEVNVHYDKGRILKVTEKSMARKVSGLKKG